MKKVFTPNFIRNLEIKNRIVLPPMVTFNFAGEKGLVSHDNVKHYEKIAKGGAGLIILEATCVNSKGKLSNNQLGIWDDKFIDGLSQIAKVCHENQTKVFIQLHHAGLRTPKSLSDDIITSSDYNDGRYIAREMTIEELHGLQDDFIKAAIRAEKAGFHGVELHGAHSYLMTQFFSEKVNKRKDRYGGSLENRIRFASEILEGIRKAVSEDFVVGLRMGSNENSIEDSINIAKLFEEKGIDYLHISTGFDNTPIDLEMPEDFPCNWIVYGGCKIKEEVSIPVIVVNSIRTKDQIEYLINNDIADFVALGRTQLADHNFVNHIMKEENIITCLNCKPCKWFKDGRFCPKYSYNQ